MDDHGLRSRALTHQTISPSTPERVCRHRSSRLTRGSSAVLLAVACSVRRPVFRPAECVSVTLIRSDKTKPLRAIGRSVPLRNSVRVCFETARRSRLCQARVVLRRVRLRTGSCALRMHRAGKASAAVDGSPSPLEPAFWPEEAVGSLTLEPLAGMRRCVGSTSVFRQESRTFV